MPFTSAWLRKRPVLCRTLRRLIGTTYVYFAVYACKALRTMLEYVIQLYVLFCCVHVMLLFMLCCGTCYAAVYAMLLYTL